MKKLILLSCLVVSVVLRAYSCDPISYSFCESSIDLVEEKIFVGRIIDQNEDRTALEIIEILKGTESKTTIVVWDGTDIECNGGFSMSTSVYGNIGDTVICMVQTIDRIENAWDILGDYRRPSSLNHTTYLNVRDDFIWDHNGRVSYTNFLNNWMTNECSATVSTSALEKSSIRIFPNPTADYLLIEDESHSWKYYSILSTTGQVIRSNNRIDNSNQIVTDYLNSGIYMLILIDDTGLMSVTKFMKL